METGPSAKGSGSTPCPHCGNPHVAPGATGIWLGQSGTSASDEEASTGAPWSNSRPSGTARRWVMASVGIAAAWLAVVGLGRVSAPDEAVQVPLPAPTVESDPPATPSPTSAVSPTATTGATPEPTVPSVEPVIGPVDSVQVERMGRQLVRRGAEPMLAYRSAEGVVLIDLAAGVAEVVEPSTEGLAFSPQYVVIRTGGDTHTIDLDPTDVLLRAAGQTIAIDPAGLEVRLVADDASLIVTQTGDDAMYWVPGRDLQGQAAEVIGLTAGLAAWFRAPHATQLAVHDGLGLVAVGKGPSGGSWIAANDDFVPLSDNRIFEASAAGVLEERCDAERRCTFAVAPATDASEPWSLPEDFVDVGDRFSLSPDATAVLRHDPNGFAEIYDSTDQSIAWVTGASMHHVAWGPDSSFVAWIDLLGAPELRVMFLDERDWLRIDLDDMGVPRPIGTELVVFNRPELEPTTS